MKQGKEPPTKEQLKMFQKLYEDKGHKWDAVMRVLSQTYELWSTENIGDIEHSEALQESFGLLMQAYDEWLD